ncbi:hypothetical protein [Cellulomonas hominis]|uniref:hypothetical protein n=1 Tax=Cellulomonas hominis TaxID=156981 RepID=UPI001B910D94|nr:hypothetical protein [Cellulomonas hominis]VTR76375.1 hypothetical protein CHMI_01135 [Cellulomonas hominis]
MSRFSLHDAIGHDLEPIGFVRAGKEFKGRSGDVMMTVYLNPENRLKRIRTVSVACATVEDPAYTLYQFDQVRAATGLHQPLYDEPGYPGWPGVIVEHFRAVTMPFIREATSFNVIVEGVLRGHFPANSGTPYPMGAVIVAYSIADRLSTTPVTAEVLAFAREQRFDWLESRRLREWASMHDVPLNLQPAPFSLRGALDPWLPLRYRKYTPPQTLRRGGR